jgi:pimeloyl-ACP methyl ester carboxylesterase
MNLHPREMRRCQSAFGSYLLLMNRRALLLVHGYPFDHSLWDQVLTFLPGDFEVLAPDVRGFGGLPVPGEDPSLELLADDLAGLLEQRGINHAVVAGMSMGGYISLAFAERHRGLLAGLGLISSQAAADTSEARAARRAMIDRIRREGPSAAAQAAIPKLFSSQNAGRADLTRMALSGAQCAGVEGLAWALEAMARRPDRTDVLRSIEVPVLVAHGPFDQFIPAQSARELAVLPADGTYVEIPDAGHATPIEAPGPVAKALLDLAHRSFGDHGP